MHNVQRIRPYLRETSEVQWSQCEIPSPRLLLKPFSPADANEAFTCITPTLTRYMSFDPPPSAPAFEAIWRRWLDDIAAGRDFVFAIRSRSTRTFIGLCGLHRTFEAEPELGIWVRESEHGHAYGREAVGVVFAWGAKHFAPAAFTYPVAQANTPSRRIAESLGGVAVAHRPGTKYDTVVYRIPASR